MKVLVAITYTRRFMHAVLHDLIVYLGEAPERVKLTERSALFSKSDVHVVLVRSINELHSLRAAVDCNTTTFSYWIDSAYAIQHRAQLYELERYLTQVFEARLYMRLNDFVIANISTPVRVYYMYFAGSGATRSLAVNESTGATYTIPWIHIASSDALLEDINSELQIDTKGARINWNFLGLLHDNSITNPGIVMVSNNACKLPGMLHKSIFEVNDPLMDTEYLLRATRICH